MHLDIGPLHGQQCRHGMVPRSGLTCGKAQGGRGKMPRLQDVLPRKRAKCDYLGKSVPVTMSIKLVTSIVQDRTSS